MKVGRILSSLALSLALLGGGYAEDYPKKSSFKSERYWIKERELEKVVKAKEREIEQEIKDRYKRALLPHNFEAEYGDGSGRDEVKRVYGRAHGNVVGKEYITVEHLIHSDIDGKPDEHDKGWVTILSLEDFTLKINNTPLEKISKWLKDPEDRGLYVLPKELSHLSNSLEIKANTSLKVGDEVFWWGNAKNRFIKTGKPNYTEAKVLYLPGNHKEFKDYLVIEGKTIPGDSGSLVVKKKTGEIVGAVHGHGTEKYKHLSLVVPISSYIRLKEAVLENKFSVDYKLVK